jgi:hypothetical protein
MLPKIDLHLVVRYASSHNVHQGKHRLLYPHHHAQLNLLVGNYSHIGSNVSDRIVVTQENGRLLEVALSGKVSEIVNLDEIGLGCPLGIACNHNSLAITTSTGWLVLI